MKPLFRALQNFFILTPNLHFSTQALQFPLKMCFNVLQNLSSFWVYSTLLNDGIWIPSRRVFLYNFQLTIRSSCNDRLRSTCTVVWLRCCVALSNNKFKIINKTFGIENIMTIVIFHIFENCIYSSKNLLAHNTNPTENSK